MRADAMKRFADSSTYRRPERKADSRLEASSACAFVGAGVAANARRAPIAKPTLVVGLMSPSFLRAWMFHDPNPMPGVFKNGDRAQIQLGYCFAFSSARGVTVIE